MQTEPTLKLKLEAVISRVSPGTRFNESLAAQLDSLQVAFLLDEIEKEFAISFPTAELIHLSELTLHGLAQAIARRLHG